MVLLKKNIIIKAGSKLPSLDHVAGDYEDWMADILGWEKNSYRTVAIYLDEKLPPIHEVNSVIITGAGANVTDNDPWINESAEWLARAANGDIPILGICFGHQLLAHALGGKIGNNPRGVEVGSVAITLAEEASKDSLFKNLPQRFTANVSHMQSVLELPAGARILASSEQEPVHAFSYGDRVWGAQFHPEFNAEVTHHFILYFESQLKAEEHDMDAILNSLVDTPESKTLLKAFADSEKNTGEKSCLDDISR